MSSVALTQSPSCTAHTEHQGLSRNPWDWKDLIVMLTWRDIKIRYKQSIMGFLWAVLMPIVVVGSGLIVMVALSVASGKVIDKADVLSIAVKSVPWAFFISAIRFATNSLTANKELVTKIYFPREIMPIASVLASLFDCVIAAGLLTVILCITRVGLSLYLLWTPIIMCLIVILAAACSLLLSCGNLFFRDVKYLVEIFLTYGIFMVPVFYSASRMGKYGVIMLLNPVGPLLESLSTTIVWHKAPSIPWLCYSAAWAFGGLILAWLIFRRSERLFAESI